MALLIPVFSPAWALPESADAREALAPVDLVVIGWEDELADRPSHIVSPHGYQSTGGQASARLHLETVLWGRTPGVPTLRLKWTYDDKHPERRTSNPHIEGLRGIYFLTCPNHLKTRNSNYQCTIAKGENVSVAEYSYYALEDLEAVMALLASYPVRIRSEPSFFIGKPAQILLVLANPTPQRMVLPGARFTGDRLLHGPGFALRLMRGAHNGLPVEPLPGAFEVATDIPDIVLPPGSRVFLDIGLSALFRLEEPGFYLVTLELPGYPPQLSNGFFRTDPENPLSGIMGGEE